MLKNKNILIVGVANKHSIAAGIAKSMSGLGANLAFTYQNDRLKENVVKLASEWGSDICLPCDVSDDSQIDNTFKELSKIWDGLDCIVHAVGFAPREELDGNFLDVTTREGFKIAHDISSYSFIALAQAGKAMMKGRSVWVPGILNKLLAFLCNILPTSIVIKMSSSLAGGRYE